MSSNLYKSKKSDLFGDIREAFKSRRSRNAFGAISLFVAVGLFLSFISFLFHGKQDQSVVESLFQIGLRENARDVSNLLGVVGAWLSHFFIFEWFGLAAFLIPPLLLNLGLALLGGKVLVRLPRHLAFTCFFLLWTSVFMGSVASVLAQTSWWSFHAGGLGFELYLLLEDLIGWGAVLFLLLSLFIFNVYFLGITEVSVRTGRLARVCNTLVGLFASAFGLLRSAFASRPSPSSPRGDQKRQRQGGPASPQARLESPELGVEQEPGSSDHSEALPSPGSAAGSGGPAPLVDEIELEIESSPGPGPLPATPPAQPAPPPGEDIEIEVSRAQATDSFSDRTRNFDPTLDLPDYRYPDSSLLSSRPEADIGVTRDELEENKRKIIETLNNFRIGISSIKATIGPTITLYEIVPDSGVKISRIKNLEDDIALSLAALGIRIIAPIPGKGTIGIEVPNKTRNTVSALSILGTEKFMSSDKDLAMVLGRTISNEVFMTDLTAMPHLLIAGATGQGKSVGLNIVLVSLLYKKHPSQLKFVLIDPKKVELSLFQTLSRHFLAKHPRSTDPIVTDTQEVVMTLSSLCIEMDQRYDLLKVAGCRNIKEYNQKMVAGKLSQDQHRYLPYVVVVIDEFADLMMQEGKKIEAPITRLAQLARAVGIHLLLATQRPSVNVITGLIKANFPARISFRVTSNVDSRTILDMTGAERLVGKGDMLFSFNSEVLRLQCGFIDTPEVEQVCRFIADQPGYDEPFLLPDTAESDSANSFDTDADDFDPMLKDAALLFIHHQQGSTSMIQRKMKLGYNRAGRIMDQLESLGIVGQADGAKPRKVLFQDESQLHNLLSNHKGIP